MLGRPAEEVGLSRMVLLPELTGTVRVFVAHLSHAPVLSNDADAAAEPFTLFSILNKP
ncbi:hypothetical protein ACWGI0_10315 [Streptomyces sp. NPDC054802]